MRLLKNNILVKEVEVEQTTSSGIILDKPLESGNKPALVVEVSDDVLYVKPGDKIYIQWKEAFPMSHNGESMAIVSEDKVESII